MISRRSPVALGSSSSERSIVFHWLDVGHVARTWRLQQHNLGDIDESVDSDSGEDRPEYLGTNYVVFEGDRIEGALVVRIGEREVELELDGRRFTLSL